MTDFSVLRCMPNGSCFQIACRLGIELLEIEKRWTDRPSEKPSTTNLNGFSSEVTSSAEDLRKLVVLWYSTGLTKEVPSLGNFDEASKRLFTRADLLALEAIRQGRDIDEKGPKREEALQEMIHVMKREGSWASTPEYIAVSHLTNCNVHVWVREDGPRRPEGSSPVQNNIVLRDVATSKCKQDFNEGIPSKIQTIHLLFSNQHQDVLVTSKQKEILHEWFPEYAARLVPLSGPIL